MSSTISITESASANTLHIFKEAMEYLRVSRSTLYRLMWSGQLTEYKVGSTWRFYRNELQVCIQMPSGQLAPRMEESLPCSQVSVGRDV